MSRIVALMLVLLMLCGAVAMVTAGEGKGEMTRMKGGMMGEGGMTGEGGMKCHDGMMQMCPMHKMMASMAAPALVATRDGGVVVMLGGMLYKYDRNLKLKAETDLKVGMAGMHRMMMQMGQKCPMMPKMMRDGSMMSGKGMKGGRCMKGDDAESVAPEPETSE